MKKVVAPLDPAKMSATLRASVLAMGPEDIGLSREPSPDPSMDHPTVWGVVMELAEGEVVVSLVALADGSVSIYLSDGSGVIGCGLHPDVRASAAKLLDIAQPAIELCTPTSVYPMPSHNQVYVYLLTRDGVRMGQAARAELDEGEVRLAEIYYAGHGLISTVELLGAGVDLMDEMRLAESGTRSDALGADAQEVKARGRGCRILPYVGNVARRSHN